MEFVTGVRVQLNESGGRKSIHSGKISELLVFEGVVNVPIRVPVCCRDPLNQLPSDVLHHFVNRRGGLRPFFGRHVRADGSNVVNRSGPTNRRSTVRPRTESVLSPLLDLFGQVKYFSMSPKILDGLLRIDARLVGPELFQE